MFATLKSRSRTALPRTAAAVVPIATLLLGCAADASATVQVFTFTSSSDTTIYDNDATRSNGAGEYIVAGRTGSGQIRRGLLDFDLSSILPGSTVTSVTLTVSVDQTAPGSSSKTLSLNRLTADWGEAGSNAGTSAGQGAAAQAGDATWTYRIYPDDANKWSTAGGDFLASDSGTIAVGGPGTFSWTATSGNLIADVQSWIDGPASNFGWLVRGNEAANSTATRFLSGETATVSLRPTLTLSMAAVPEPETYALLLAGLGLLAFVARRRGHLSI